jgi:hypothetical protein
MVLPGVCFVDVPNLTIRGRPALAATNADARFPCIPILRDRARLDSLPGPLQVWVHFHEVAHAVLGHGNVPNDFTPRDRIERELLTDCQATRMIVSVGWDSMLDLVLPWIESRGAVEGELAPGSVRAARIRACRKVGS